MKPTKRSKVHPLSDVVRHTRLTCLVSDEEMRIIDGYLQKYGIENKSRNLDHAYPTLFNAHDMRR